MSFVWNAYQQRQISEVKTDAIAAKADAAQYSGRVVSLEAQVNQLALACQSMWELLRAHVGITEQELLTKMHEVDLRDGAKDRRMRPILTKCPKCGKTSNTKNSSCMYCGALVPKRHLFE